MPRIAQNRSLTQGWVEGFQILAVCFNNEVHLLHEITSHTHGRAFVLCMQPMCPWLSPTMPVLEVKRHLGQEGKNACGTARHLKQTSPHQCAQQALLTPRLLCQHAQPPTHPSAK